MRGGTSGKKALNASYTGALDYFVSKAIGMFQRTQGADELRIEGVPQDLIQKLHFEAAFRRGAENGQNEPLLENKHLSEKWREQGESFGWGPKEAVALLHAIKRGPSQDELKSRCLTVACKVRNVLQNATLPLERLFKRQTPEQREHQKQLKTEHTKTEKKLGEHLVKPSKRNDHSHSH